MKKQIIKVVYDSQCPACALYCELAEANALQSVELLDARESSPQLSRITRLGLDIDEGMVVEDGDQLHYGADAIHRLTQLSSRRGSFRFFSRLLFANPRSAQFFYPWLRRVRNLLLKLLRKKRINNLGKPGQQHF